MTYEDMETLQRMLGKIEAIAFVVSEKHSSVLLDVIEVIDGILERIDRKDGGKQ